MVFQVPPSKASIDQNVYKFHMPGDRKTYKLPKLRYVKPALVERIEGGSKIAAIRMLTDEYIPGLFDRFDDADQLQALYEDWAKESGISLGESSGSDDSSESTAEPSDATS